MIGSFFPEKAFKNYAYLLVDAKEGTIENISACNNK